MRSSYQARWISKDCVLALKKTGKVRNGVLLDSCKGFIFVEPPDSRLGDGALLSRIEADYEVRSAWCLDPETKIGQARRLLHLDANATPVDRNSTKASPVRRK
jgi:hypothetical protein